MEANLVEIFASIQGEGMHVGVPTVFVRFGECDLRCAWCDSPNTWKRSAVCRVESEPGGGNFVELENPVPVTEIARWVSVLDPAGRSVVSLTGGEPLLQAEVLGELCERLRGEGRTLHLETHGLATDSLPTVASRVDVIAMDWKLASEVKRAEPVPEESDFEDVHEEFLRQARQGGADVFVKVVVTGATRDEELDRLAQRIASVSTDIPLIIQPVTPIGRVQEGPQSADLIRWQAFCGAVLSEVRVIPQTHRSYGAL